MNVPETLKWIGNEDGFLRLIDQRLLPGEFKHLDCKTVEQVWDAIKTLAVRGAPAIGVAAAYGVCVAAGRVDSGASVSDALKIVEEKSDYLAQSRPTAVNLFWAIDRMKSAACKFVNENKDAALSTLKAVLLKEAHLICEEDKQMCQSMGKNGAFIIKPNTNVLTHCNAGALATAGIGTALSLMYVAKDNRVDFKVYADETRPLGQGARITSWELSQAGVDVTVICDNMAGMLMKDGKINAVVVGSDRIAANGDAANKIGTYSLSVLAKEHNIGFYVVAPSSTFDLSIKTGLEIPIEQRDSKEVSMWGQRQVVPDNVKVYNPAFDVTPAENITAIVTEKGVINSPCAQKVCEHFS